MQTKARRTLVYASSLVLFGTLVFGQEIRLEPPEPARITEESVAAFQPISLRGLVGDDTVGKSVLHSWVAPASCGVIEVDGGKVLHVWAPPGEYTIRFEALLVDWEQRKIDKRQAVINLRVRKLGPDPNPDPEPEPDPVPDDAFGNLGREVAAWRQSFPVGQRHLLAQVAAVYDEVAARLEGSATPLIVEIGDATEELQTRNREILAGNLSPQEYRATLAQMETLGGSLQSRWQDGYGKAELIQILRIIARGMKG